MTPAQLLDAATVLKENKKATDAACTMLSALREQYVTMMLRAQTGDDMLRHRDKMFAIDEAVRTLRKDPREFMHTVPDPLTAEGETNE